MNSSETVNIHCENIGEFSRRQNIAEEQRRLSVSELVETFVSGDFGREAGDVCEEFRKKLPMSTYEDRARLCMALGASRRYGTELWRHSFFGEEIAAGSHGKVALVRNRYNESAFSCFSKVITTPKEVFSPSFSAACEDVYDSRCEFCILPVENSRNGRLFGFYSMLDRYELKICAVCEPDSESVEGSAKYALVGRAIPDRVPKNAHWSFEFSVISDNGKALSDISGVADIFGARLSKIDSLPVEYDSGLQKYYFTFDLPEKNIPPFHLFMSEEYTRYTLVGLYPRVDQT
ncbi:MAG: hypothetical protein IJ011_05735 [Clostridia bacterium]|nr:hypothetical protein [Clostridia bacterium]